MEIYTIPKAVNAVHFECSCGQTGLDSEILKIISEYIIGKPTTYFLGIDEDSICQIKTNSTKHSYIVYKILLEKLQTTRIWVIHKGKIQTLQLL